MSNTPQYVSDWALVSASALTMPQTLPLIQFMSAYPDQHEVGRLTITEDGLTFEGDADASAAAFFTVLKQMCDQYLQSQQVPPSA